MSESLEHQNYVKRIVAYAKEIIPNECVDQLFADLPDYEKPYLTYDSFIPDVMYSYKGMMLLGEAKTFDDFNREHSRKQYEAYFRELSKFVGEKCFVVAVPWELFISAKNHFKLMKKRSGQDIKITVISGNGKTDEI